jgi:hypothetical protein
VAVVDLAHAREQGFTSGVNNYCSQLIGCAQMGLNNEKVMDMGQPVVAAIAGILNAVAVGATYTPTDFLGTGDLVGGQDHLCSVGQGDRLRPQWGRHEPG